MIARIWRGVVRAQDADEYAAYDQYLIERDLRVTHYQVPDPE